MTRKSLQGTAAAVVAGSVLGALGTTARRRAQRLTQANRRLSADLADVERQMSAALGGLEAAVLIQRPNEGIVYANAAAATAMGMASTDAVVASTPGEIAKGWVTFNEDGTPLRADQYPSRRLLRGERWVPPLVVRTINRRTGREYWRIIRAQPVFAEDGSLRMTVSLTEDITELKRAELTQRILARAGEILSSSLDYGCTLRDLAALAVPELADWCSIGIPDERGVIAQVAVAHADPAKVHFARMYHERYPGMVADDRGAAEVLRTGLPLLVPDVPDDLLRTTIEDPEQLELLRSIGMRSVLLVPIVAPAGPPLGVLSLVNAESGRVFRSVDEELASELGRRAGVAIQNARLYEERSRVAATLQASLLPDALAAPPGFALETFYRAAGEESWVGGDFFDSFPVEDGWIVLVGDVAGRGVEAAALTAQARHTLRAIAELTGHPARAVAHLHRLLAERGDERLCTVCAVRVTVEDDGSATACVVCAGHPLPYLVRSGEAEPVGQHGPMVGAFDDSYEGEEVDLEPGDVLVLFTDGVLDARGADHERFGDDRLQAALSAATGARDATARIAGSLDFFQAGAQADDTAVLALQRLNGSGASGA